MANLAHGRRFVKTHLLCDSTVRAALSPQIIEQGCRRTGYRWRHSFWSPSTTVLTFLLQVLDGAKTLRAAVATVLTQLAAQGETDLPSPDPSAYCQARLRLPLEVVLQRLAHLAARMRNPVGPAAGWRERRVWVVDGSSLSMPDTPELQKAFPQPSAQRKGCGFPVAQFVALFCWTSGAVVDAMIDSLGNHELTLARDLWRHFRKGDVVLGDRLYGSYVDFNRLLQRGVWGVFRLHQRRKADFRAGRKLGPDDQLVVWPKPPRWIPSMGINREEFEQLPETLTVRLVRTTRIPHGFRSRTVIIATTLLDPIDAPADEIRALYRDRWTAELNFRSLKTHLGMDVLRSQSPDMVRKEIAMYLLAYNLIRLLMWEAARAHGRDLHRLSFTGTLHRLRVAWPVMVIQARHHTKTLTVLWPWLLAWVAKDAIPDRPDRIEPRRRKRRPKNYSLLTKPRAAYRGRIDRHAR